MEFLRGFRGAAWEAPPHPQCLVIPLCLSADHWVSWGKAIHTNLPPGMWWKNYIQDDKFLLVEEEKLKIKGTKHHWHEAGCGPFQSVAVKKEHLVKAHPLHALNLWPQMVIRKLNPNKTLRLFEVDAWLGKRSFKLLFSPKPAIPLVTPQSKVPAIKIIPYCIPSPSWGTVVY